MLNNNEQVSYYFVISTQKWLMFRPPCFRQKSILLDTEMA